METPPTQRVTMQCMEVWGGNRAASSWVSMPGLDAWVFSRPYAGAQAGGDIHYVSSCASGKITRLLVSDVAGHGVGVAEIAVKLRDLMRRHVNIIDQTRVCRGLNREFASLAEGGGFATAVVATYWAPRRELVISNAGHPRPLHYDGARGTWSALRFEGSTPGLANIPLGIAEPTAYDQTSFRLRDRDMVLFYTDALVEAKLAGGRMLGEDGLLRLVGELDPGEPQAIVDRLIERVHAEAIGPIGDDITTLLVRPNGVRPRRSIAAHLKGAADVAIGLLRR